jgi:hypothetical protein
LRNIYELGKRHGLKLVIKPHPAESKEKLQIYREKLPGISFIEAGDPIEFIYYVHSNLKVVMAHSSSGLLYADLFGRGNVNTIALAYLYGNKKIDPVLARILAKAGAVLPKTFAELAAIFEG